MEKNNNNKVITDETDWKNETIIITLECFWSEVHI